VLAVALIGAAGCGSGGQGASERRTIDEIHGTYRGVGLDAHEREITAAFGRSPPLRSNPVTPTGSDVTTLSLPTKGRCPNGKPTNFLRYRLVSFIVVNHRACEVFVTEDGAATQAGVAIGDELSEAEETYPQIDCGDEYAGEGLFGVEATEPYCAGRMAPRRFIWFGGDPINVILLRSRPFD
jgi:hypothetical protein